MQGAAEPVVPIIRCSAINHLVYSPLPTIRTVMGLLLLQMTITLLNLARCVRVILSMQIWVAPMECRTARLTVTMRKSSAGPKHRVSYTVLMQQPAGRDLIFLC